MHQVLLLVDFVGLHIVLPGQTEDAILSWSNVSPTEINPLCFLILQKEQTTLSAIIYQVSSNNNS